MCIRDRDTSGAGALSAAREVLAHTDLVLADLKFSSEDGYRAHTGGSPVSYTHLKPQARACWMRNTARSLG